MASNDDASLIDITFQRLQLVISGQSLLEPEQLASTLRHRKDKLKNPADPFSPPSNASKAKVESGKVKLSDDSVIQVEEEHKDHVFKISEALDIDQVDALVIFRGFILNEGLPQDFSPENQSLVEAITGFYFDERIAIMQCLSSLVNLKDHNIDDVNHAMAAEFLPEVVPDQLKLAKDIVAAIAERTTRLLRPSLLSDPRTAARWAKQNLREQLCLLEILFAASYPLNCDGDLVQQLYEALYKTDLGAEQKYAYLMLDEACGRLRKDIEALFLVVAVQVLKLDKLLDEPLDLELVTKSRNGYLASPERVESIHNLIFNTPLDPRYSPILLAWGFVITKLTEVIVSGDIPDDYSSFASIINPTPSRRSGHRQPAEPPTLRVGEEFISRALECQFLVATQNLLRSPLLSTAAHSTHSSSISEPNNGAYRYVLKCLLLSLVETTRVEYIADYNLLVAVWSLLFGSGEMPVSAQQTSEFWSRDIETSLSRRSLLDLAKSRFPVESKPFLQLLRSMSGIGGLDELDSVVDEGEAVMLRIRSAHCVYQYFDRLTTFTQVLSPRHLSQSAVGNGELSPLSPLFEVKPDRSLGYVYINTRPVVLPGGSVLPVNSVGRLLTSNPGGPVVVSWDHQHSGWTFLLAVLQEYQKNKLNPTSVGSNNRYSYGEAQMETLSLQDIGLASSDVHEDLVAEILDLFRSLLHKNWELTSIFASGLSNTSSSLDEHPYSNPSQAPPDLVHVTLLILKDSLSYATSFSTRLVTSAIGLITALLPILPGRVWPFLRNLPQLFGDDRQNNTGTTPILVNQEKSLGTYQMTLSLLDLVGSLFDEAFRMVLTHNKALQDVKREVMLRALRFVTKEVWNEFGGWRFSRLREKFELGRKVVVIFAEILKFSPSATRAVATGKLGEAGVISDNGSALADLTEFVLDTFLFKATASTVNTLIITIATGRDILGSLRKSMRAADADALVPFLEWSMRLARLLLVRKGTMKISKVSLLEQTMFLGVGKNMSLSASKFGRTARGAQKEMTRLEPIDIIAGMVKDRSCGEQVSLEVVGLLSALCRSVSFVTSSTAGPAAAPSIVSHLSEPEVVAESFVRVLEDPWEDSELRKAVWDLVAVAVDTQPAFAGLFVGGELQSSSKGDKRAEKVNGNEPPHTALNAAITVISTPGLWDFAPDLLAASLGFLDLVWQHALEHLEALKTIRKNTQLWKDLADIAMKELGDPPSAIVESTITEYGETRAEQNEAVAHWAFHTMAKAHALHIFALDLKILPSNGAGKAARPDSFASIEKLFKDKEILEIHVQEALRCSFNPELHEQVQTNISIHFPSLTLDSVRSAGSAKTVHQNFGDQYIFLAPVVYNRLMKFAGSDDELVYRAGEVFKGVCSINLDWSLMDAQVALARSWKEVLKETAVWLRDAKEATGKLEEVVLDCAVGASRIVADETREGPIMVHVHADRLSLLQSLLDVTWLARKPDVPTSQSAQQFAKLVKNVRSIVGSDNFRIIESVRRRSSTSFHRTLLYIIYFCARVGREQAKARSTKLEDRLSLGSDMNDILGHVVDALRVSFDMAAVSTADVQAHGSVSLDQDIQLFVAVFDQCTRAELHATPSMWLARCQEAGLFKSSLELLVRTDLLGRGAANEVQKRQSLALAEHVLQFHVTLAAVPASAERLAHEGVMSAYCKNDLSPHLEAGIVDAVHPDYPGERSPYHRIWCTMLGVTTSLVHVLGPQGGHFIETEILGFVQLYGAQLTKVLGWNVRDSLTLPLLEELDRVVGLFHGIATQSAMGDAQADPGISDILRAFSERALFLVQNVNYALTHPNHLATLLEPMTFEERTQMDKEENAMSVESSIQLIDAEKRPVLSALIQKLLTLSRDIVATLLIISKSDQAFTTADRAEWPPQPVPVIAQSKVSFQEPASIGTLLELGTLLSDVLKHFSNKKGKQPIPNLIRTVPSLHAFDSKNVIDVTEEALEQICLYALIQLATVVHRSYPAISTDEAPMDAQYDKPPTPMVDPRVVREWKDLAIDLNLLAKGVPAVAGGPSSRVFFDLISQSSFELVDKLDGTRHGKRMM